MDAILDKVHIEGVDFGAKVPRVLSEPRFREAAGRVSESIRSFGGIQETANLIERFASAAQDQPEQAFGAPG